jgi:predicted subunit of tRNA(5-methylaminomethyl-2-thiouridylate) methyltransferase
VSEATVKPKKAYVLTSGGLDSTIAVKMLQEQGIDVTGVYVSTGFCLNSHQKKAGRFDDSKPDVFKVTEELGIDLEVIDISKDYLSIITNPVYGWGKNVNPCIDCRIHMLQKTRELMKKNGFDFIATGEVLGQRPMSQRSDTSKLIEEKSGLKGFLLRPLSGQLHRITEPERLGWVDRKKLGHIQGRSRKHQFRLAKHYNLQNVSSPAGGCCLLTDETYAVRFKDYLKDRRSMLKSDRSQPLTLDTMMILGTGRQVKIRTGLKLVMGRDEGENKLLTHYGVDHVVLEPDEDFPGPTALLEFVVNENGLDTNQELEKTWGVKMPDEQNEVIRSFLKNCGAPYAENLSAQDIFVCASILARYADSMKDGQKTKVRLSLQKDVNHVRTPTARAEMYVLPIDREDVLGKQLVIKPNEKYFVGLCFTPFVK